MFRRTSRLCHRDRNREPRPGSWSIASSRASPPKKLFRVEARDDPGRSDYERNSSINSVRSVALRPRSGAAARPKSPQPRFKSALCLYGESVKTSPDFEYLHTVFQSCGRSLTLLIVAYFIESVVRYDNSPPISRQIFGPELPWLVRAFSVLR